MTKKKFAPSAAAGYKRIKPLFDKLQVDVVQQAEVIEELEVERVLLKTQLDRRVKKCKQAGLRVAELLRLCKAQQTRNETLVSQLNTTTDMLNKANAELHQYRRDLAQPESGQSPAARIAALTSRNQGLARKNLELAELSDKYRGQLENLRIKAVYSLVTVAVLALGYGLWVIK